jgi:hyaluronan synthase
LLAFLLEISAWMRTGEVYLFALFMLIIWLLWGLRIVLAAQYRPWQDEWTGTVSVIIPVVDEPLELFRSVLDRIAAQRPTEVIVVINGPRNRPIEGVCAEVGVRWCWTETPGKRHALKIGLGLATGEIAVLVDSDTIWTRTTLRELVKPFHDPQVGGVTTRQRILDPGRTPLTRWADWLENVRNEYSFPATSVLGTVGCLPGRTIAFRRVILARYMGRFLSERFLGIVLEVSDDRTLTNYTLQAGYKTVYQATALVYTDAPTRLAKLVRQQYRWARGSQYNTLRMLPWMLRYAPVLSVFYVADILVPFVLVGSFASWTVSIATGARAELYAALPFPYTSWLSWAMLLGLAAFMTVLSLAVRFGQHFAYRPSDLTYLPLFMVVNTFVLMPIRVLGFVRMAHNGGWGTRANGFAGDGKRNPLVVVPYLLGVSMLAASVVLGV